MKTATLIRITMVLGCVLVTCGPRPAAAQFGDLGDILRGEIEREIEKIIPRPEPGPIVDPLPSPIPRPQPTPHPQPRPQPRPQPYPGPSPQPQPQPKPAPAPPPNKIIQRIVPAENASVRQIVLTEVLERGPAVAVQFSRWEASEIARLLQAVDGESQQVNVVIEIAKSIAADERPVTQVSPGEVKERVSQLRDSMQPLRSKDGVPAGQLAILAERAKNMNNMLVLGDLARLLGVQRRQDIFAVLSRAAQQAGAPDNALVALTGFAIASIPVEPWDPSLPEPVVGLFHPRAMTQPVNFVIDREITATLAPGELAWLDQPFEIAFDTGAGSTKRYTLSKGIFAWRLEGNRWEVGQRVKMRLALNASRSPIDFQFVMDGQRQTLRSGEVAEILIQSPVRISYDTGNGELVSNVFHGGEFQVGVNVETGGLDLIPISTSAERREPKTTEETARQSWRESLRQAVLSPSAADPANREDAELENLLQGLE